MEEGQLTTYKILYLDPNGNKKTWHTKAVSEEHARVAAREVLYQIYKRYCTIQSVEKV